MGCVVAIGTDGTTGFGPPEQGVEREIFRAGFDGELFGSQTQGVGGKKGQRLERGIANCKLNEDGPVSTARFQLTSGIILQSTS